MAKRKKKQNTNRLIKVQNELVGTESSEDLMLKVMLALSDSEEKLPRPGAVYIFNYYAKTPGLLYDRYPLVAVEGVYSWGFRGINLHLGEPRQYDFNQSATSFYSLKTQEVATCRNLPLKYLVQN